MAFFAYLNAFGQTKTALPHSLMDQSLYECLRFGFAGRQLRYVALRDLYETKLNFYNESYESYQPYLNNESFSRYRYLIGDNLEML